MSYETYADLAGTALSLENFDIYVECLQPDNILGIKTNISFRGVLKRGLRCPYQPDTDHYIYVHIDQLNKWIEEMQSVVYPYAYTVFTYDFDRTETLLEQWKENGWGINDDFIQFTELKELTSSMSIIQNIISFSVAVPFSTAI